MRIAFYSPYMDTLTGGEKYILSAAAVLAQDHAVSIFWDDRTILEKATKKFAIDLQNVSVVDNIFSPTIPLSKRLRSMQHYDDIIVLSDGSIPLSLKKNLSLHFQFPVDWVSPSPQTKVKLSRVKHIFCNSEYTKQAIDRKFHVTSSVVYPPCEMIVEKKKEQVLLSVGRFSKLPDGSLFKRQDVLISAFQKMVDNGLTGWKLLLAVSYLPQDSDDKTLEKLVGKYPIEIVRNASHNEITRHYATACFYWHAAGFDQDLVHHPEYAEHFGMSTVEAMSAGAIPLVFQAGGQNEIITDGKTGYLWKTVDELIRKTQSIMNEKAQQQAISTSAKLAVQKFSADAFAQNIKKLFA